MKEKMNATAIRDTALPMLRDHYELPYDTMLIYEMLTGDWSHVKTGRADIALVRESRSIGIELKAETDTLKRLQTQVADYDSTFDECWLITHERLFKNAEAAVPEHWGLAMAWTEDGESRVRMARPASTNPNATAEAALNRIWTEDVKRLAKRPELWFGSEPERLKAVVNRLGKYQIMQRWLGAVQEPEHRAEIRAEAIAAYRARRAQGNAGRTGNKYGPTMTIGAEIDRIERWSGDD